MKTTLFKPKHIKERRQYLEQLHAKKKAMLQSVAKEIQTRLDSIDPKDSNPLHSAFASSRAMLHMPTHRRQPFYIILIQNDQTRESLAELWHGESTGNLLKIGHNVGKKTLKGFSFNKKRKFINQFAIQTLGLKNLCQAWIALRHESIMWYVDENSVKNKAIYTTEEILEYVKKP